MITDVKKISIGWALCFVPSREQDLIEVIAWCSRNIVKNINQEFSWSYELHITYTYFIFDRESDMLLFILRWS